MLKEGILLVHHLMKTEISALIFGLVFLLLPNLDPNQQHFKIQTIFTSFFSAKEGNKRLPYVQVCRFKNKNFITGNRYHVPMITIYKGKSAFSMRAYIYLCIHFFVYFF